RNVVVYAFAASVILALSASPTQRKRAEVTAVAGPRYTVRRRPPTRHGRRRIRGGPHGDGGPHQCGGGAAARTGGGQLCAPGRGRAAAAGRADAAGARGVRRELQHDVHAAGAGRDAAPVRGDGAAHPERGGGTGRRRGDPRRHG